MANLFFAAVFFIAVYVVGVAVARLMPGKTADPLLAPVLGFAGWSSAVTLLYLSGLSLRLAALLVLAAATTALLVPVRRRKPRTTRDPLAASLAVAMLLVALAPGLSGGEAFRVFHGNDQDQLNYLSFASAYGRLGHDEIAAAGHAGLLANNALAGAQKMLEGRPAVSLSLAAFASLTRQSLAEISYAYLACLQALLGFAAAFMLRGLTASPRLAILGGMAFALGFFGQFALDLDAWSQLAAMAVATAGLGLLLRFGFRAPLPAGLLLASLLLLYPEGVALYGTAAVPLVLRRLRASPWKAASGLLLIIATAGLLVSPLLFRLISYVIRQSGVGGDDEAGWARHFFAFLFGRDGGAFDPLSNKLDTAGLISGLGHSSVNVLAGLMGLYPLTGGAMISSMALGVFLCLLIAAPFIGRHGARAQRLCLTLASGAVFCLLSLAWGHPYVAGKAWLLLSPVLLGVLLLPLLQPRQPGFWRMAAWLYLAFQLAFGLWRPVAATAPDGIAYPPPYPSLPLAKAAVDWSIQEHKPDFARCRLIELDLQSSTLDRYLQTVLTEWGMAWYSARPITTDYTNPKSVTLGMQKPPGTPDCLAADTLPGSDKGPARLIWLGRSSALDDFTSGLNDRLDILALPLALRGLHAAETYQNAPLRWTDGRASLLLPLPPDHDSFTVDIALWPVRAPGTYLELRINGVDHFNGVLPDGPWQERYDVPAPDGTLRIEILSSTFQPEGDPRRLGVSLQHLSVTAQ